MFAPAAMQAGGDLPPFDEMKLPHLKEKLAARRSTRSGLKATLQRRLHGLLIEAAIALRDAAMEEEGMDVDARGAGETGGADATEAQRAKKARRSGVGGARV